MGVWSLTCQATGSLRHNALSASRLVSRDVAWAPGFGLVLCKACTLYTQTTSVYQPAAKPAARKLALPFAKTTGTLCNAISIWQLNCARLLTTANSAAITGVWPEAVDSHDSNLVSASTSADSQAPAERTRVLFGNQSATTLTAVAHNSPQLSETSDVLGVASSQEAAAAHAPCKSHPGFMPWVAAVRTTCRSTLKPDGVLHVLQSSLKDGTASLSTVMDAAASLRNNNQVQPAHIHAIAQAALQVLQHACLGKSNAAVFAMTEADQASVTIKEDRVLHNVDRSKIAMPAALQQQYIKLVLQITNLINERARADLWDIKVAAARQTLADEFCSHSGGHTTIPPGVTVTNHAAKRYAALQFAETCCEYMAATAPLVGLLPGKAKKRGALHMFRSWVTCALQEMMAPGSTTEFRPNQEILHAVSMSDAPGAKALTGEQLISIATAHKRMPAHQRPTRSKSVTLARLLDCHTPNKGSDISEEFGPEQHGLNEAAEGTREALDTASSAVLVAYLATPERLVRLFARLVVAGNREVAICHRLGDLLTPLVPASRSPSHKLRSSTSPYPSESYHSAGVPPHLQLTPTQMVSVASSLGAAGYHHKPFFQAMSAAMLAPYDRHTHSGTRCLDVLTPAELAALMSACASVNHQDVELMSGACSLASHWLQHKTSSSLISLLSGGQSVPTPHPLQPFSLQQLSYMADAVVCTGSHTLPVGSALLSAICQEAAAQLFADLQQIQQTQHQHSRQPIQTKTSSPSVIHQEELQQGHATSGSVSSSSNNHTKTKSATPFSPAVCPAVVNLCQALHQAGCASSLLLDSAAALLHPHLDHLPAQALIQLLDIYTPAVHPSSAHSCFALQQAQPTKLQRSLQHRQQLLNQLVMSLIPHVQQMNAASLAVVTQRLSASHITAVPFLEAVSNRLLLLLGSPMVSHGACSICAPVTVDVLPAIPAAISVVIAQAAQGFRSEPLLARLANVLRACSPTHHDNSTDSSSCAEPNSMLTKSAVRGMITNVLQPAELIGLAASYAHVSANAQEILQLALACIDFKKASSRVLDDPLVDPGHAVWDMGDALNLGGSEQREHLQPSSSHTLVVPTFSQLVELLWATLLMPHAAQLQPCCSKPHNAQAEGNEDLQSSIAAGRKARPGVGGQRQERQTSMYRSPAAESQVQLLDTFTTAAKLHRALQQLKIQDVFDPTVILLAQAHMIYVAHASNRSGGVASLATGSAAAGFVNSLRYAWDQHLRHVQNRKQQMLHQQPLSSKHDAAQTTDAIQEQLSQCLKDATSAVNISLSTPSKTGTVRQQPEHQLDLAHACRRMLLQVDGFVLPIELAMEVGGQMVALSCHGRDHYCMMSDANHAVWASHRQDSEALYGGIAQVSVSKEHLKSTPGLKATELVSNQQQAMPLLLSHGKWQEAILSQLGWSIVQIPYWEWQATAGKDHSMSDQGNSQLPGATPAGGRQTPKRLSETAAAPASVWQQARSQASKKSTSQSALLDPIVSPLIRSGSQRSSRNDQDMKEDSAADAAAQYIAIKLSALQTFNKS